MIEKAAAQMVITNEAAHRNWTGRTKERVHHMLDRFIAESTIWPVLERHTEVDPNPRWNFFTADGAAIPPEQVTTHETMVREWALMVTGDPPIEACDPLPAATCPRCQLLLLREVVVLATGPGYPPMELPVTLRCPCTYAMPRTPPPPQPLSKVASARAWKVFTTAETIGEWRPWAGTRRPYIPMSTRAETVLHSVATQHRYDLGSTSAGPFPLPGAAAPAHIWLGEASLFDPALNVGAALNAYRAMTGGPYDLSRTPRFAPGISPPAPPSSGQ